MAKTKQNKSESVLKGLEILKKTVKQDLRHKDYDRVTSLSDKYSAYSIADEESLKTLLKRFVPREDEELFKQRVKLTSLTTPDIINCLTTPMYKVGRTTASDAITWKSKDKSDEKLKEIKDVTDKFYGNMSLKNYLSMRMVELDSIDPNSFIIVEFDGVVDPSKPNTKAKPYPFEANSHEAINYEYKNNELQWIIVMIGNNDKFTIYLENDAIVATLISNDKAEIAQFKTNNPDSEIFYKGDDAKEEGTAYVVEYFDHKAGRVPARRVGTKRDPKTRFRTCVPMIHPAQSYLEKAIKTVSEFDLTNALHTFPKVFRYDEICPGNMAKGIVCDSGKVQGSDTACPECNGTGWKSQTSTAQEFIVKLPKEPRHMVSLENMMAYKSPSSDILEFQKKLGIIELRESSIKAVYNSDTYVSDSIVKTATESGIDLEAVYDTLKPFADNWSEMWKHIVYIVAAYRDHSTDIDVQHSFPKDFKMKSIGLLLTELKQANDSGAPSYIKKSVIQDIAMKMYIDYPEELLKIQVKEKFFPFNGKSESEINSIMTSGLKSKFDLVLYANYDQVFDELEQEMSGEVNFYRMEFKKQKELIKKKVDEIIVALDAEEAATRAIPFNTNPDPNFNPDANV